MVTLIFSFFILYQVLYAGITLADVYLRVSIDQECQDFGFDFGVSKWQCEECGGWSIDEEVFTGTSVTGTCEEANWNVGDSGADGIIVKAGSTVHFSIIGTSGTVNQEKPSISHITFCGYSLECGNGVVDPPEECELPETNNNQYCGQTTSDCSGHKLGTRDAFGDCDSSCGCVYDPFVYQCVEGECGAECDEDSDCPCPQDGCVGPDYYDYPDYGVCLEDCTCDVRTECIDTPCKPSISYNDPRCMDCEQHTDKTSCNNDPECDWCPLCQYTVRPTKVNQWLEGKCVITGTDCGWYCEIGYCGATCGVDTDCPCPPDGCVDYDDDGFEDDLLDYPDYGYCVDCPTSCYCEDGINQGEPCEPSVYIDDPSCIELFCGDGIITPPEECEPPGTSNNVNCGQTTSECLGNKLGTRDAFGDCDVSCGCVPDNFVYICVKDECGAECDSDDDCDDCNVHTIDTCNLDTCSCEHETQPYCGDGNIDPGEECEEDSDCDDQNEYTIDTCVDCVCYYEQMPYCGDGNLDPGEECEDDSDCPCPDDKCVGFDYYDYPDYGICLEDCTCDVTEYCIVTPCKPSISYNDPRCTGCEKDSDCDDGNSCTIDECIDKDCIHTKADDGTPCDDGNPYTFNDFCINGLCFGQPGCIDSDGDGYGGPLYLTCDYPEQDCDDSDPSINPGATELCNNIDDDCDGSIDEDFSDLGEPCSVGIGICEESGVKVCSIDGLSTICNATPGSPIDEICDNGLDDDCDGLTDGDDPGCYAPPEPYCGDGNIDPGEECEEDSDCDDQDEYTIDTCVDCVCYYEQMPYCGDGNLDPGEECDDGNNVDGDGCNSDCTLPYCGNGILDPGEECEEDSDCQCPSSECMLNDYYEFPDYGLCLDGCVCNVSTDEGSPCEPTIFYNDERCVECISNEDCDDGNENTIDECVDYSCVHTPVSPPTPSGGGYVGGSFLILTGPIEEAEEKEEACTENWNCTDWSECINGTQARTCTDLNECGTEFDRPLEIQICLVGEVEEEAPPPEGPGGFFLLSPTEWVTGIISGLIVGIIIILLSRMKKR